MRGAPRVPVPEVSALLEATETDSARGLSTVQKSAVVGSTPTATAEKNGGRAKAPRGKRLAPGRRRGCPIAHVDRPPHAALVAVAPPDTWMGTKVPVGSGSSQRPDEADERGPLRRPQGPRGEDPPQQIAPYDGEPIHRQSEPTGPEERCGLAIQQHL